MKAIIEFDLPEEQFEFNRCNQAEKLGMVLWDIDGYLREQSKYHDNEQAGKIRDKLYEIMSSYNIDLDELAR